jgi:hypothetical protein
MGWKYVAPLKARLYAHFFSMSTNLSSNSVSTRKSLVIMSTPFFARVPRVSKSQYQSASTINVGRLYATVDCLLIVGPKHCASLDASKTASVLCTTTLMASGLPSA